MQENIFNGIHKLLSSERLGAYGNHPAGDLELRRYVWNYLVCESLYTPLHLLEVGLRNAIDRAFTRKYSTDWLFDSSVFAFTSYEADAVPEAIERIEGQGHEATRGRVIAEVPFSFWTGLLYPHYDEYWYSVIKTAFPGLKGKYRKRSTISVRMNEIRHFRNKVFHHDRIVHRNVAKHYSDITEGIAWLCPELRKLNDATCSFPSVYGMGPDGADRYMKKLDRTPPPIGM